MSQIFVSFDWLKKIKASPLDFGLEASCYLFQNKVIKIYWEITNDRKIYFDGYMNLQIAFPNEILYLENTNKILGYTMPYFQGEKLLDGFREDLTLTELKKSYLDMKKVIEIYKNIYMKDLCLANMIYDYSRQKICLLDTSQWFEYSSSSSFNVKSFNIQMISALLRNILNLRDLLADNIYLEQMFLEYYLQNTENEYLFLDFLGQLEKQISQRKGLKIKTIDDLLL